MHGHTCGKPPPTLVARVIKLAARNTLPRVINLYKGTLGQRPRARRAAAHVRSPVKLSAAGELTVACAERRRI